MFHYYGRKMKLARFYPTPIYGTVVEPFAGSAAYSLHGTNWQRDVVLVERDELVCQVWSWLIDGSDAEVRRGLPDLALGEFTANPVALLCSASKRWFTYHNITVTKFILANYEVTRRRILRERHKVRHWRLIAGDYSSAPDVEATWFIDPPYCGDAGTGYRHGSDLLDYPVLATWARARRGHVIVCEAAGAGWLPFRPLVELVGIAGKRSAESVWTRLPF